MQFLSFKLSLYRSYEQYLMKHQIIFKMHETDTILTCKKNNMFIIFFCFKNCFGINIKAILKLSRQVIVDGSSFFITWSLFFFCGPS